MGNCSLKSTEFHTEFLTEFHTETLTEKYTESLTVAYTDFHMGLCTEIIAKFISEFQTLYPTFSKFIYRATSFRIGSNNPKSIESSII